MTKTIRAAIIGYGRNGSTMHAGAVEQHPGFEMAAVCDIDSERRRQAVARFDCPVYEDYNEMLRKQELDLVCVVTRTDQHVAMACDCLKAGVDVLVTKPWAQTAAEARQLVSTAEATGRRVFPWLPARWGSGLKHLQQLLAADTIGEVFMIRRINSIFATRSDWQTEKRYGGGYLLNWGPHLVDPLLVLTGRKVASVYGCMRQLLNPGDTEDLFAATIIMDNGCILQIEQTISAIPLPDWVVQGTRGTITINRDQCMVRQVAPSRPADATAYTQMAVPGAEIPVQKVGRYPYGDEHVIYKEIYDALCGKQPYSVTTQDALYLSEVLDAIRLSYSTNSVINMLDESPLRLSV